MRYLICPFVWLTISSFVFLYPVINEESSVNIVQPIKNGAACNYSGKMVTDDPCVPWCICKQGRAICAQIFCSTDIPLTCAMIQVNGRCCPALLCAYSNGTSAVRYDLPWTEVPPAIFTGDN